MLTDFFGTEKRTTDLTDEHRLLIWERGGSAGGAVRLREAFGIIRA
jgi:hypothetical protein